MILFRIHSLPQATIFFMSLFIYTLIHGEIITNPPLSLKSLGEEYADQNLAWYGATPIANGHYDDDTFSFSGNGIGVYYCWDRSGFAYIETPTIDGDFMFTARVKSAPTEGFGSGTYKNGKVGICVKPSLSMTSPVLSLRWDYYWQSATEEQHGLQWFNRTTHEDDICLYAWNIPSKRRIDDNQKTLSKKALSIGAGCDNGQGAAVWGSFRGHWNCLTSYDPYGCIQGCIDQGYENQVGGFTTVQNLMLRIQRIDNAYRLYAKYPDDNQWSRIQEVNNVGNSRAFDVPETQNGVCYVGLIASGAPAPNVAAPLEVEFDNIELRTGDDARVSFAVKNGSPPAMTKTDSVWMRKGREWMRIWGKTPVIDLNPSDYGIHWPLQENFHWKKYESSEYTIISQCAMTDPMHSDSNEFWAQADLFIYKESLDPEVLAQNDVGDHRILNHYHRVGYTAKAIVNNEGDIEWCEPCKTTFAGIPALLHSYTTDGSRIEHGAWTQYGKSYFFTAYGRTFHYRTYVDKFARDEASDAFKAMEESFSIDSQFVTSTRRPQHYQHHAVSDWYITINGKKSIVHTMQGNLKDIDHISLLRIDGRTVWDCDIVSSHQGRLVLSTPTSITSGVYIIKFNTKAKSAPLTSSGTLYVF